MALEQQEFLPLAVNHLHQQVQEWRRSKKVQFAITLGEFWGAEVSPRGTFRVFRIARTVGLDCGGLRKRVAMAADRVMSVHRKDTRDEGGY